MKNLDPATEIDASLKIIWEWAVGVAHRIEKRVELGWKVRLIDVLSQLVEVLWITSF